MLIREVTAADRAALAYVFDHLGEQSRYQRFLSINSELGARELDRLIDVDHWHHEALIACSPIPRAPIGVARYVRGEEFDLAELAIAVVDDWQRRGVGAQLALALRDRALRAGIRRFTATMLSSNRGALALARRLGPCAVIRADTDVIELAGSWR
jgi:RimJ/RimL family protein N-acetyltransferase